MSKGIWHNQNCILALGPNSWSKGTGDSDQNTGEFPCYPDGSYNATLTNMGVGYGYLYNAGDGYLNFDGTDDSVLTTLDLGTTDASKNTFEFKIQYNQTGNNQLLLSQFDAADDRLIIFIDSTDHINFFYTVPGTNKWATSSDTLSDATDYTIHCIKDGTNNLQIFINKVEVTYSHQDAYNLGTLGLTAKVDIGHRSDNSLTFAGKMYWVAIYDEVLTTDQIKDHASLPNDMLLEGSDTGDIMTLVNYQKWNPKDCVLALAPNSWSKDNGTSDQNTGEFPGYPVGTYNATLMSMGVGYGYVYNSGDGYLNFDGVDDYISTVLNPQWTNVSTHSIEFKFCYSDTGNTQVLAGQYDDNNNRFQMQITSGDALQFLFVIGGVVRQARSTDTLTDGECYTAVFIKDGANLIIKLNGSEVTYAAQDSYDLGTKSFSANMVIGDRDLVGSVPFTDKMYWVAYYDVALTDAQIAFNAGLPNNMGMSGNNSAVADVMTLSRYQVWHNADAVMVAAFNSWSRGNGDSDQNTGEMPGYPDGSYNMIFTNMGVGYGYQYGNGDGYCDFDGSDDSIASLLNPTYTNTSKHTWEVKLQFTDAGGLQTVFEQLNLGDLNNYSVCYINGSRQVGLGFNKAAVFQDALSSTTLTDKRSYTLHFIKDGAELRLYINGIQVSYSSQDAYAHGSTTYIPNTYVGGRNGGTTSLEDILYWAAYYDEVLTEEQIKQHFANNNDMGMIGTNVVDVMTLSAPSVESNFIVTQFIGQFVGQLIGNSK